MPGPALDIAELRAAYASGRKPADVIDDIYDRIDAIADPGIFITLLDRDAVKAAAASLGPFDADRPLWGIPFAVKDNIDAADIPTTAACHEFAYTPSESAPAVAKCVAAGAILIGKTNLDQFATGLVGVRTPYPVPLNPYDPTIVPGGSSSGSAVAVSRGLVGFALGTDTAGSGRVPAALNNLVGLKPSLGAISNRGMVPACRTLDTISVFANTVDDAWLAYRVIAGVDTLDPFSRPIPLAPLGALPPKIRLGIPRPADLEFYGDEAAQKAWHTALDRFGSLPVTFTEIDMRPFLATAQLLYDGPWVAERAAATKAFFASHRDAVFPVTRKIIESAEKFSASDAFEGLYFLMERRHAVAPVMASIDALCVPTLPRIPTVADLAEDPIGPNSRLGLWTNFVNLLDMAALAVPGPFRDDGRPAGITLIGTRGSDRNLACIGRSYCQAETLGATEKAAEATTLPEGYIELAVVGAHLSGMPLNHELTSLEGIFRRAISTKAAYRLYALPGGPPARPGLVRVGDDDGHAIETEVWALPAAGFGRFVAAIPSPLGIGTIEMADGTRPKGFLAEAVATAGARDISALGGWRAFMRQS